MVLGVGSFVGNRLGVIRNGNVVVPLGAKGVSPGGEGVNELGPKPKRLGEVGNGIICFGKGELGATPNIERVRVFWNDSTFGGGQAPEKIDYLTNPINRSRGPCKCLQPLP